MRNLRNVVILGIFAGAGCTSSEPSSADGGNASVMDSANGATSDSSNPGSDGSAAQGGDATSMAGEAAASHGSDGGASDAMATESGSGDTGTAATDGGGTCTLPACLTSLESGCIPSGSCSQTTDSTTGDTYTCYQNGITRGDLLPMDGNNVLVLKNASSVCYSITYSGNTIFSDVPNTSTVSSASDAGLAILSMAVLDGGAISWSVTCTGGTAVELAPACQNAWPIAWMGFNAPQGCATASTCSF
jgi:hypothetical protein